MMEINKNTLDKMLGNDLIITGGHFLILENGQPNLNSGTIDSFKSATMAYKAAKEKGFRVQLGILINNMGGVCDTKKNICVIDPEKIKNVFKLPNPYIELLTEVSVQPESVKIYWEKSLRNRGKKELLKKIKQENSCVEYKEGAYWFVNPKDGRRITLSRPNPNDKYGIAACPLIMAAFAQQMEDDGFKSSLNFYYVDTENEENIPNYFAIEKGRTVSEEFYKNFNVMNVYILKDKIITSFDLGKI